MDSFHKVIRLGLNEIFGFVTPGFLRSFLHWVYLLTGFRGLQCFQCLSVILLGFSSYLFLKGILDTDASKNVEKGKPFFLVSYALLLLLTSTNWYLRPQLFSLILFQILIFLAESKNLRAIFLIPLTLVWVNTHIYWPLIPLTLSIYALQSLLRDKDKQQAKMEFLLSLLCTSLGFLNPYGFKLYRGIYRYMFSHEQGYALITEFQPLSTAIGLYFWVFCLLFIFSLLTLDLSAIRQRPALIALSLICAALAISKIKYIPLFAVPGTALLLTSSRTRNWKFSALANESMIPSGRIFVTVLSLVLIGLLASEIEISSPLEPAHRELFEIVTDPGLRESKILLNEFNDGGWLALALYLDAKQRNHTEQVRTSIDGRTLVMGPRRLSEYSNLLSSSKDGCKVLLSWGVGTALLRNNSSLGRTLEKDGYCGKSWQKLREYRYWTVLQAPGLSAKVAPTSSFERSISPSGNSTT